MDHTFTVHGVTLNMDEMYKVYDFYRICDLADRLIEIHPRLTEEKAMEIASEAYVAEPCNEDDFYENLDDILEREGVK